MKRQSIMETYKELQAVKKSFEPTQEKEENACFIHMSLNARINYKGYVELKGRQFGTLSGLGMREVYFRAWCNIINYRLFSRYYRYLADSNSFKGWKTYSV